MKTLKINDKEEMRNSFTLIKDEIETIKEIHPKIESYKKRFYNVHEKRILELKKNITREKSLSKIVFKEKNDNLKKIKANYKKDLDELKIEKNYELYELKETRKLSLDKMKASSKNYTNELSKEIEKNEHHKKLLSKNKNPEVLKELESIKVNIDRLKMSNESIKTNYKRDKIRENALLQNDGVRLFARIKKMKDIKEELKEIRNNNLNINNEKIKELELKREELLNTKAKNVDEQIKQININIKELNNKKEEFEVKFKEFYSKEEEKINSKYDQDVLKVNSEYEEEVSKIKNFYDNKIEKFLNENNKDHLKNIKLQRKNNVKKYQKELKELTKEIKEQEKANKEETKEYILRQRNIKKDARLNMKILKEDIKETLSHLNDENEYKQEFSEELKNVSYDIKSMNKVLRSQKVTKAFKNINTAYFFIAPAVFGALVFTILPLLFMLVVAFFKLDIVNLQKSQFVGFNNFYEIFKYDVQFRQSLTNTLIYALITIGLLSIVTLSMAAWLSKNTRIHNAVTTMVFTPHIASLVAISILWIALLSPTGLINQFLALFGIEGPRWLLQENTSLLSVSMVTVWKDIGYYVLLIIAGLQAIPAYVYEAAKLDKSTKSRTFFKITVPLLAPTLSFVFVNKFINSFKVFAPIEIMTNGGPMGSSTVLSYWIYKVGRLGFNYGQAMAGAIVLTLIITFFTIINFKFFNRKIEY